MNNNRNDLAERFSFLENDDLLCRYQSGDLTDLAKEVAIEELQRRQIPVPALSECESDEQILPAQDLFLIATYSDPTKANIVNGCLVAAGVPAVVADANMVQTYSLITLALGGVRILVPKAYVTQANEIINAFEQGAYQLPDDVDVGEP